MGTWLATLAIVALVGCHSSRIGAIVTAPPPAGIQIPIDFAVQQPRAMAHIDGHAVRLLVDLGGYDTVALRSEALKRLPMIREAVGASLSVNAAGESAINWGFVIPQLRLGELELHDVEGHQIDLPDVLEKDFDGYIGFGVLKRFRLLVNYPESIVLFPAEGSLEFAGCDDWTTVRVDPALRTTKGFIHGARVKIGWDTGANYDVIDKRLASRLFGVEEGFVEAEIQLDGHSFGTTRLAVVDLSGAGVDALMGHGFFTEHRVLFDFKRGIAMIENDR